jgi:hypothetical protein
VPAGAERGSEYSIIGPDARLPYDPLKKAAERDGKFHAEWIPYKVQPAPPGKIYVRAPAGSHGHPVCPDLHLTPEQAEQLRDELGSALNDYTADGLNG